MKRLSLMLLALTGCDVESEVFRVDAPPLRLNSGHVLVPHEVRDCTLSTDIVAPAAGDEVRFSLGVEGDGLTPDRRVTWCVGPGDACVWWLLSEPGEPTTAVRMDEPGPWRVEARIDWADDWGAEAPLCSVQTEVWVDEVAVDERDTS